MIETRLRASVQHEFNGKLEALRAELTARNDRLKEAAKDQSEEVAAMRSTALAALTGRSDSYIKRRIEAVDQLWSGVVALGQTKVVVGFMKSLDYEKAAEECTKNPHLRQIFKAIAVDITKLDRKGSGADLARPFVTPMAWAYFDALSTICVLAATQMHLLTTGLAKSDFTDKAALRRMIEGTLPHQLANFDKLGSSFIYHLGDELEQALMKELYANLSFRDLGMESLERAAEVVKGANEIVLAIEKERAANA
ncbi:hypothetical protein [Burkholderia gladioli]|uniref:hypothetical protein n=1 Tax=Burkholderia gladioli TaxID=28095 RepID=UPI001364CFBE|nr:hypothetical protein [Burkholderia gladioli]